MPSLPKYCFAGLILSLFLSGCTRENAWSASQDKSYSDNIQQLVETKIDEQTPARSGRERWNRFKSDEYQTGQEITQDRKRLDLERKRQQAAERLISAGPLSLTDCLAYSLEFNDRIQANRAVIRSTDGEELIAKSRFLPTLTYDLAASVTQNLGRNVAHGALVTMNLLEFGKDNSIDVALRESQRNALFGYENQVADVLSDVRRSFFTILLRKQQLAQRQKLRDEFAARYKRMVQLEKARRVLEVDVLTAKLNVLNEDSRINALEKEITRQKMGLLKAIGFPVGMTDFRMAGEQEKLDLPLTESVDITLKRSTRIAQARAVVYEQDRVVRQIIWEYLPDIHMQGGYNGNFATAAVDVTSTDSVYAVGPFGERRINAFNDGAFGTDPIRLGPDRSGWRWSVDLSLPVFTGLERTGRFRRENALLEQARRLLSDTTWETALAVGTAHETVLEEAKETEVLDQTVRISKERLAVQERLKELGKITDDQLETFRERFFDDQDAYFEQQIRLIEAQEQLRSEMRYFEPVTAKGK